jgi:hypothetical protein
MTECWHRHWRSRTSSPYRVLVPLWFGMWVVLSLITAPWRSVVLYNSAWEWAPAALLFLTGLWLYKRSGAGFKSGTTRRFARSHSRTSRAATGYLRHSCSRPSSNLPCTFVRNVGLERWHGSCGLLRIDGLCAGYWSDDDSARRHRTGTQVRRGLSAVQTPDASSVAASVLSLCWKTVRATSLQ